MSVFSYLPLGSIPAHAGEPSLYRLTNVNSQVYPRACGGTNSWILEIALALGLSPRMRGNPDRS